MEGLKITEVQGSPRELAAIQRIFDEAPEYHFRTLGQGTDPEGAKRLLAFLPPEKTFSDKFVFTIHRELEVVGVVCLVRDHPSPGTALLHEFLLAEPVQHRGVGTAAFALLLEQIRPWPGIKRIRVELPQTNRRVEKFLQRIGFHPTTEIVPYRAGQVECPAGVFERPMEETP